MTKYNVRFSVVKEFEAENKEEAWHELITFCEDNDCHMLQNTIVKKAEDKNDRDKRIEERNKEATTKN